MYKYRLKPRSAIYFGVAIEKDIKFTGRIKYRKFSNWTNVLFEVVAIERIIPRFRPAFDHPKKIWVDEYEVREIEIPVETIVEC